MNALIWAYDGDVEAVVNAIAAVQARIGMTAIVPAGRQRQANLTARIDL